MTKTTTPTATLPVLNYTRVYEEDETGFEFFADSLALWARQWVPEISVPIMRRAQALLDEPAVCILLGKWHDAYTADRKWQRDRLRRAAMGEEFESEGEGGEYEFSDSVYRRELGSYNDALRALLIK